MRAALYYRSLATTARRLATKVTDEGAAEILRRTAQDYEEIADDIWRPGRLRSATRT
jgi:hypothetical protein